MAISNAEWTVVLEKTLHDVLGHPLQETPNLLTWAGKETARGDKSRSFTYTREGQYAGVWKDWTADVGGRSVFDFLSHWYGWNKAESLAYLVQKGFIPAHDEAASLGKPQKTITYEWVTLDGQVVKQYRFEYQHGKDVKWQKGEKPPLQDVFYPKTLTQKTGSLVIVEGAKCAEIAREYLSQDIFTLINATTRPSDEVLKNLIVEPGYDQVFLWPDNDRQGRVLARELGHRLKSLGFSGEDRRIRVVNSFELERQGDAIDDVDKSVAITLLTDSEDFIEDLSEGLKDLEWNTLQYQEAREVYCYEQAHQHGIVFVSSLHTSRGFDQAIRQAGCELRYDVRKKDLVVRFGEIGKAHKHFANLSPRQMQPDGWRMRDESLMRAFTVFFQEYVARYAVDKNGRQYPNLWEKLTKDSFRTYGWNYVRDVNHHGDSFMDYLENLPRWDGEERLDYWLRDALGVEYGEASEIEYHKHCSRQPFLNAINRAYDPGAKCDEVLTLVGPQGVGKSQVIAHLTPPEWQKFWVLGDYEPSAKVQDLITDAHPVVFVELAEVDQIAGYRSTNRLKRMLSRQFDVARLPWHEASERADRQFVNMATANDQGKGILFDDASGNRRFLTVLCHSTKDHAIAWLNKHRDQLWAEALVQRAKGVSVYLPDELAHIRDSANEAFVAENPLQVRILEAWENGIFEAEIERNIELGEEEHWANHMTIQRIAELIQFAQPYPLETSPNNEGSEEDQSEIFGEFQVLTRAEQTEMGIALKKLEDQGFVQKARYFTVSGKNHRKKGYLVPRLENSDQ